jgi:hypothetical protein
MNTRILLTLTYICFLNSSLAQQDQSVAEKTDQMLVEKTISTCNQLSEEIVTKYKNHPKKIMRNTCSFVYKKQGQACVLTYLNNQAELAKLNLSEAEFRKRSQPAVQKVAGCLVDAEENVRARLVKASTDQKAADAMMAEAVKQLEKNTR